MTSQYLYEISVTLIYLLVFFRSIQVPKGFVYSVQLRKAQDFHVIRNGVYALPDCDEKGNINKKFVIVELVKDDCTTTYVCSCDKSRRSNVLSAFDEHKLDSEKLQTTAHCIHIQEATKLFQEDTCDTPGDPATIFRLTSKLLASYCESSRTFGVLTEGPKSMKCLTCTSKVTSCAHMKAYKIKAMDHGFDPNSRKVTDDFVCISTDPVMYPLQDEEASKFIKYTSGALKYPQHLVPDFDASHTCSHGFQFDSRDPVEQKWIWSQEAHIHMKHVSLTSATYFRPSLGDCSCAMSYDGANDLLLNLDNKHLFTYSWLFDILHDTQETRYPLAAAFRSANRTRTICGQGPLGDHCYNLLRVSYNCFLRLLDFDFPQLFNCHHCGTDVECVIMDGIMMGSRQDLLPHFDRPEISKTIIPECSLDDRVFLNNATARRNLSAYAGLSRGRYVASERLSIKDFKELCQSLQQKPSLLQIVKEAGRNCPKSHQKLLGEIARGSPTCGMLQITNKAEYAQVWEILRAVAKNDRSVVSCNLDLLKMTAPMLVDILTAEDVNGHSLALLVDDLLKHVEAPFHLPQPEDASYAAASEANKLLEFFPNRPLLRGAANYKADGSKSALVTGCRKDTMHHNTLTPGLFTLFCPHGVCLGFQIMENAESPKTAFDILVRRFDKMPKLIIYDNACKLHLYCLKREPMRFRNSRFMVDRLHFRKGHIGCSLGYSMDSYQSDHYVAGINSQANEQANASLRRLATQLTYMPPSNVIKHTSVFLAIRNIDKILKYW